ncbi:MAG TPA: GNAT family N-acetyltransferase [Rhizomicrobium sp.]|nr:GNAT family N-acetyltransferase [Rhizomicrobium sp.]
MRRQTDPETRAASAAAQADSGAKEAVAVAEAGPFVLKWARRIADLEAQSGRLWPDLCAPPPGRQARYFAFQCRDHLERWLSTIGAACGVRPIFVAVFACGGEPLLLLPLGVSSRRGVLFLEFLDGGVADYNAPVLFEGAASTTERDVRLIWEAVRRIAAPFDVERIDKLAESVCDWPNPLRALGRERWPSSGHLIRLATGEGAPPLQKKHDLKEGQRKRQRLSEIGTLRFRIATDPDEIRRVFAVFARQKSRRYRETLGVPGFDVPGQLSYYSNLALQLSGRGAQLAYLEVGGEVIATAWSLIADRRLYYLMCAYEGGAWRRFSPGSLLLEDLVGWAARNGLEAFDLGIGDEAYKLKWRQEALALSQSLVARTLKGRAYCAAFRARALLREALPARARHWLRAAVRVRGGGASILS